MTIQNAWSNIAGSLPTYAFADGQIGVQQADGALLTRNPDGTLKINLLPKRRGISDALIAIGPRETYIGVAITSSRSALLPPAASYPPGQPLVISDEAGTLTPTVMLTLTPSGSDTINGASSFVISTAFGGATLYCDGVSKWTTRTNVSGGVSNAVLYVPQSLPAGQQDQARANISGAVPATQSATQALGLLDFDRDQYVTGTATLTMPGASPGWRSGIVTNDNAVSGLVTLAVPAGHFLNGVTNGSLTLFPRQRARLRMFGAGSWRTDWIDRSPILVDPIIIPSTAPVASLQIALPVGYGEIEIEFHDLMPVNNAAGFNYRLTNDGFATLKSGATDYSYSSIYGNGGTVGNGTTAYSQGLLTAYGVNTASGSAPVLGTLKIAPGSTIVSSANNRPVASSDAYYTNTAGNQTKDFISMTCASITDRANGIQIYATSGNFCGAFTVRGRP